MNARQTTRLVLLALFASLCLAPAAPARAADTTKADDLAALDIERAIKQTRHKLAPRIMRYLNAAHELLDEGKPEEAQAILGRLNLKRLNPHELAYVYRSKATVAYFAGDYATAIEDFENVLKEEVFKVDTENKIRFNIAQIHASLEQWQAAIDALNRWFRYVEDPDPLAYYLLGIAYYQLEKFDLSIENTEKAVDLAAEPNEGWLQLLAALYIQKEDYANAAPILEELVMRFPKKQYWVQLSLIYGARDQYRASLAVQQVAYMQGFLTESKELLRLARSYLYHDLPYPAAEALEKGLKDGTIEPDADSYELLANSLIAAREYERSLAPLQKAAELADDGNLFVRLGQVHLQREEWGPAADNLEHAIGKGGLKHPGNAELLLGIAYYNLERVDQARSSFVRARAHDATREAAARWITHIENEARTG